jgi:inhibitor of growth protein 3
MANFVDFTQILEDFTMSIDNLPSEIKHIFEELREKDIEFQDVRSQITTNDLILRKMIKTGPQFPPPPQLGSEEDNQKENQEKKKDDSKKEGGESGKKDAKEEGKDAGKSGSASPTRKKAGGESDAVKKEGEAGDSPKSGDNSKTASSSSSTGAASSSSPSKASTSSTSSSQQQQPPSTPAPASSISSTSQNSNQPQDPNKKPTTGLEAIKPFPDQHKVFLHVQSLFETASQLSIDKIGLVDRSVHVVDRHIKRLQAELDSLEKQGALPEGITALTPILPESPFYTPLQSNINLDLAALTNGVLANYTPLPQDIGTPAGLTRSYTMPGTALKKMFATPAPIGLHHHSSAMSFLGAGSSFSTPLQKRSSEGGGLLFGSATGGGVGLGSTSALASTPKSGLKRRLSNQLRANLASFGSSAQKGGGGGGSSGGGGASSALGASANKKMKSSRKSDMTSLSLQTEYHLGGGVGGEPSPEVDEQIYCFCRQVSYGEMIGCDGENCPTEWFHLECVGLKESPKGLWFCPDCQAANAAAASGGGAGGAGGGARSGDEGDDKEAGKAGGDRKKVTKKKKSRV